MEDIKHCFILLFSEGYLTQCTFDYLTNTFDNHLFVAVIFTTSYVIPMSMIIYYYSQIVSNVINHEKALKEQAKKMNVESLRSNQNQASQSAEIRIAKAAITICFLFVASWTPYAVLALIGAFGDHRLLTPGVILSKLVFCARFTNVENTLLRIQVFNVIIRKIDLPLFSR